MRGARAGTQTWGGKQEENITSEMVMGALISLAAWIIERIDK